MIRKFKNYAHLLEAIAASILHRFPSKKITIIGVTGTDGKTTTTNLIYAILKEAGKKAAIVSTIGAAIGGKTYDIGFHVTTPSSFSLQKYIRKAVDENNLYMVLEITSHALDQNRAYGIQFDVGVLTNISHEHLDYHKTYDEYVLAKTQLLINSKIAVLNKDDRSFDMVEKEISKTKKKIHILTYGLGVDTDINPRNFAFKTNLVGEFNIYNCLAAITVCKSIGVGDDIIRKAISEFQPLLGRQNIVYDNGFKVIIDFAHTPNAFAVLLPEIRKSTKGRIIHVFGSAAKRDVTKRPIMGQEAARIADIIVLTAEDPRKEPIEKICDEIELGIKNQELKKKRNVKVYKIVDRKDAIEFAVSIAKKGDTILITGKGHEKSMNYGKGEEPWDEFEVTKNALEKSKRVMIKKIYFVGIKGVGMATLAVVAKQAGFDVRGSDIAEEFITDAILQKENIFIDNGFESIDIEKFIGDSILQEILCIVTAAHGGFDNPQALYAKEKDIKILSHGQAVGFFMDGSLFNNPNLQGISIAGSHGKTTITAMMATAFSTLGLDPSYTIGTSEIFPLGSAGHYGKGEYFIAEADEYFSETKYDRKPKFLYQNPKYLIINNIDFDHPDIYKNFDEVEKAFLEFANHIKQGYLFINVDGEVEQSFIKKLGHLQSYKTYGESDRADYRLVNYMSMKSSSTFDVLRNGKSLGTFEVSVPGKHNALNSLAVISLLHFLGFESKKIANALTTFKGTKRRLEVIGRTDNGAVIIDDYAHHPKEIIASLTTLKSAFPDKKIICIFQSHTYSRTKALLEDFVNAFSLCDHLICLPIFSSAREEKDEAIDSKINEEFEKINKKFNFFNTKKDVIQYVTTHFNSSDFLITTMGAGNVYEIAYKLIQKHEKINY